MCQHAEVVFGLTGGPAGLLQCLQGNAQQGSPLGYGSPG